MTITPTNHPNKEHTMYFDRVDICEAYYVFASLYYEDRSVKPTYGGIVVDRQGYRWSPTHRIFGRLESLGFRCRPSLHESTLTENGREIFARLVERNT